MKKIQITVSIPEILANEISYYVDGATYRNRSHIVHQAIAEWIKRQAASRRRQLTIEEAARKPAKARPV